MRGRRTKLSRKKIPRGFTLMELMVASVVMLLIVLGGLSLFMQSNKISIDQQQYADIQNNVRSAMYFLTRDIRNAGAGETLQMGGYCLEGVDGYGTDPEASDSLKLTGVYDDSIILRVDNYTGAVAHLVEGELRNSPYNCPGDFENREYKLVSASCPHCYVYLYAGENSVHGCTSGEETINFNHGHSPLDPPGKKKDTGCLSSCWDNAVLISVQIKHFWLDTTGNPSDYPEYSLAAGVDGYLGVPNTMYLTTISSGGSMAHFPLAHDIENLQLEYRGDLDNDGTLDSYQPWDNANWTILESDDTATRQAKAEKIARIREVMVWVLGKTNQPFVSIRGQARNNLFLYRRPGLSNSTAATADDRHRRFLLKSTVAIRNASLSMYNTGTL